MSKTYILYAEITKAHTNRVWVGEAPDPCERLAGHSFKSSWYIISLFGMFYTFIWAAPKKIKATECTRCGENVVLFMYLLCSSVTIGCFAIQTHVDTPNLIFLLNKPNILAKKCVLGGQKNTGYLLLPAIQTVLTEFFMRIVPQPSA